MKYIVSILILLSGLIASCTEEQKTKVLQIPNSNDDLVEIPNKNIDKSMLYYDNKVSIWTINGKPYSGYIVAFYEDSLLKEKIGVLNGKKEGQAIYWFADGELKQKANYHDGKLHGEKKLWSSEGNHRLITHLNYHSGKPHGEQKQWYQTGELYKKLNLNMGREEGPQQAFRKTGDLYANYEAKDGRIFGLKKASLCYGLEDENIKYIDK